MAKINEVLVRLLGLSSDPNSLNYYNLLQLSTYTSDAQQIAMAIQQATVRIDAAAQSEPAATIEAAKKIMEQCSAILTHPQKKRAYDRQLRALLEKSGVPISTAVSKEKSVSVPTAANKKPVSTQPKTPKLADTQPTNTQQPAPRQPAAPSPTAFIPKAVDPLAGYLPSGDPFAEFSMKEYLSNGSASPPIESVESRLAEIEKLRSGVPVPVLTNVLDMSQDSIQYGSPEPSDPSANLGSIQQRIRRKRAVKNAMAIGGLCFVSMLLLAVATWKYFDRPPRVVQKPNSPSVDRKASPGAAKPANGSAGPRGGQEKNDASQPTNALPSLKANSQDTQSHFTDAPKEDVPTNSTASEMTTEPEVPAPAMQTMPKEGTAWDKALKQTRESIAKKDFEKFNTSVDELMAIPVSDRKQDDLRQIVDRTGQLYKFGTEAFDNSIKKLQSGVTLNTGDDTISCVEAKETELIFRVKGKNTTFKRNELPSDILVSLLNLELDPEAPVDVATRGVFFKLYNSGEDYQKLGDKYLDQAAKADPKFSKIDNLADAAYHPS